MHLRTHMLVAVVGTMALTCGLFTTGCGRSSETVSEQAAPPPYVEEGATVNGTVVAVPPEVNDYVSVGDAWYYWHPSLNVWVHTHHPADWKPPSGAKVYHNWADHPMYHRR